MRARTDDIEPSLEKQEYVIAGEPVTELLMRIRAGNPQALALLHDALYTPLWRLALHLVRSAAVAEDVLQDVFLALWLRRETLKVEDDIRAYLYTAVRNRARDHIRHEHVVLSTEQAIQSQSLDVPLAGHIGPGPGEALETQAFYHAYQRAVGTLTEREALVLFLRWEEEMTLEQMSHILELSIEGTRKILARVQKKIQNLLREYRG